MTTGAWIMLGITWAIVICFTARFYYIILKRGGGKDT